MIERAGLRNRFIRSALSFMVAGLMIGGISYLGLTTYKSSHAVSGGTLYVSPNTANVTSGSTISVTIREDSGSASVNSVQASLKYNANNLEYVGLVEGGAFPVIAATSTGTPGVVRVGRANSDTTVTGDQAVATINFKVLSSSGTTSLGFDQAYSFLVSSTDNKDILQNVGSASYTMSPGSSGAVSTNNANPMLYLDPANGSYASGATINVAVRLNAFTTDVSTVEAAIGYPSNQLQYISTSEGGVYTTKQRTNATSGVVDIIRSIAGGGSGVQGDKVVVTITFKVIGTAGTADLSIASASAAFDTSGSGLNILNAGGSKGATYTLSATSAGGSNSTPPSAGAPGQTTSGSTTVTSPSQAITLASKRGDGSVSLTTDDQGSALTQLGGQVNLTPVIDPAIFAKNPNETINKVEYYMDSKLVSTQKVAPFTYKFDTTTMRNGTYTMLIKTYYGGGTVDARTEKILVRNKVTLTYVVRHFLISSLSLVILLVALALLAWRLVLPRMSKKSVVAQQPDHDILYGFSSPGSAATNKVPVASDPTVVAPNESSVSTYSGATAGITPLPLVTTSAAASSTGALPLNTVEAPPVAPPDVITTPSAGSVVTPGATITPDMPIVSDMPVTTPESAMSPQVLAPSATPTLQPVYRPDVSPPTQSPVASQVENPPLRQDAPRPTNRFTTT